MNLGMDVDNYSTWTRMRHLSLTHRAWHRRDIAQAIKSIDLENMKGVVIRSAVISNLSNMLQVS